VSSADSDAVLADIHLHSPDYREKAIAEFEEILKTNPNHAASCRGLGYAYLQKQDLSTRENTSSGLRRRTRKIPVHYYSALLMSRQGHFPITASCRN